ncbi:MAG: hypothetical protein DLM64_02660 [Solirubrobacterales bacterium]|nr:MAG: hypothetical protein DLM64_02660 [Solirubrobacterales bacterium]
MTAIERNVRFGVGVACLIVGVILAITTSVGAGIVLVVIGVIAIGFAAAGVRNIVACARCVANRPVTLRDARTFAPSLLNSAP